MSLAIFLQALRSRDIELRVEGDQLRVNAPKGALTPDLRDQLRQRKNELLEFLLSANALATQARAIVPLQPHGDRAPVFAVPGHNGDVFCYRALARHLGDNQPFFGLQPPGLDGYSEPLASVEEMAAYFAEQILAFQPNSPFIIAGYCAGGTIAFELARQLVKKGGTVRFVVLFGSPYPAWYRYLPQLRQRLSDQFARVGKHARALAARPYREYLQYFREKLQQRRAQQSANELAERDPDPVLALRANVEAITLAAVRRHTPDYFPGHMSVLLPSKKWVRFSDPYLRWHPSLAQSSNEYCGPDGCDGDNILREPYVSASADLFRRCRDKSDMEFTPQIGPGQRMEPLPGVPA